MDQILATRITAAATAAAISLANAVWVLHAAPLARAADASASAIIWSQTITSATPAPLGRSLISLNSLNSLNQDAPAPASAQAAVPPQAAGPRPALQPASQLALRPALQPAPHAAPQPAPPAKSPTTSTPSTPAKPSPPRLPFHQTARKAARLPDTGVPMSAALGTVTALTALLAGIGTVLAARRPHRPRAVNPYLPPEE